MIILNYAAGAWQPLIENSDFKIIIPQENKKWRNSDKYQNYATFIKYRFWRWYYCS